MPLNELDINKLSRLTSQQVDHVTCIECCKYYIVPTTATCGHTLCHTCWRGRRTCPSCGSAVDRKALKLNLPLQDLTEHVHVLGEEFEKLFHVKLDEFLLDTPSEKQHSDDPSKHVKDWLASSENQFSAPQSNSQQSSHNKPHLPSEFTSNKEINSYISKNVLTNKTVHVRISQDDWDKIEVLPDTEDVCNKKKENVIGPMDIEPFTAVEFTTNNQRRSSRKKDIQGIEPISESDNYSSNKSNIKNSTMDSDSKILKQKNNWANVKRMKKEFSKLNKKNRNKLNVSIEMCKKSQNSVVKNIPTPNINIADDEIHSIDDNTPQNNNHKESATLKLQENIVDYNVSCEEPFYNVEVEAMIEKDVGSKKSVDSKHVAEKEIASDKNILPAVVNKQTAPVTFIMKGALQSSFPPSQNCNENCFNNAPEGITVNDGAVNTDDIEITIKIGNTLTNICIKKKEKDVQLKINTDREIQTSLEKCEINNRKNASCSPIENINSGHNIEINMPIQNRQASQKIAEKCSSCKNLATSSTSNKKNTGSADTATAHYEITASVEKELSKIMENMDTEKTAECSLKSDKRTVEANLNNDGLERESINDLDLFDNDSVKEGPIQLLKSTKHTPSEILVCTVKSTKSGKKTDKRIRDFDENDLPTKKRLKTVNKENNERETDNNISTTIQKKHSEHDSELTNYDAIMGQVFANIDADMEDLKIKTKQVNNSQVDKNKNNKSLTQISSKLTPNLCESIHGLSENVFSLLEKDNNTTYTNKKEHQSQSLGEKCHVNLPVTFTNCDVISCNNSKTVNDMEFVDNELSTPVQENDDSDKSIVEETPQKSSSFLKLKQNNDGTLGTENAVKRGLKLKNNEKKEDLTTAKSKPSDTPDIMSVIDLSDITDNITNKNTTVVEAGKPRQTLETPLTIHRFVDQIKHKSTPMARKSLNFDKDNTEKSEADPEQTLCPSSFVVAKTTQEREFMSRAFEQTPNSDVRSPLAIRNIKTRNNKYYIAGSCLTPMEISNVKLLCSQRGWVYIDKYTNELTHLVVGVDEERKSQRSVKYMCALAASKWIVSYEWVEKCLQLKKVIDEEPYEALDGTGEPGPRRSRIAKQKLFQGITFYCMPPFSVLDVNALKGMLVAAGGRVVDEAKGVRVTGSAPALLLAEPEHTQEDRFMYLAMELSIVPVNYEWVLNCLGSYTVSSVQELLLCPASLLPPATSQWPQELMAREYD